MTSQKNEKNILDQKAALHAYLDDLLQEVPEENVDQPESIQQSERIQVPAQDAQATHPEVHAQEKVETKPVLDMPVLREVKPVEAPAVDVETKVEAKAETNTNTEAETTIEESVEAQPKSKNKTDTETDIPDWAQERFQCLLFNVAGISLAVPLVKLNGVLPWDDEITPMPGHSKEFLGLLPNLDQNVKVVDTAQIVLPQKQQDGALLPPEQRLNNVILVDDGRWGLACDSIGEVITLEPEEVHWRTSKGKLKWLAGTVLEHLCALLEIDSLTQLLQTHIPHQDD